MTGFLRGALRLDKDIFFREQKRTNRLLRMHQRLHILLAESYQDLGCRRLVRRLKNHREDSLLHYPSNSLPSAKYEQN